MNTLVGLGVASVGTTPVSYVMVSPLQVLVLGIPTMLFYSKVRKSGMLLILSDESTASIEHENETMIQKVISRLIENKRVLAIAHELRSMEAYSWGAKSQSSPFVIVPSAGIVNNSHGSLFTAQQDEEAYSKPLLDLTLTRVSLDCELILNNPRGPDRGDSPVGNSCEKVA